jgi:hypothetical protein
MVWRLENFHLPLTGGLDEPGKLLKEDGREASADKHPLFGKNGRCRGFFLPYEEAGAAPNLPDGKLPMPLMVAKI